MAGGASQFAAPAGSGHQRWRKLGWRHPLWDYVRFYTSLRRNEIYHKEWLAKLEKGVFEVRPSSDAQPGTNLAVGINRAVWESFDASDRQVIEAMAACEYARSLAEFNANNARSLRRLRDEGTVKILKFDDQKYDIVLPVMPNPNVPSERPNV
jgi:hypothetical protein